MSADLYTFEPLLNASSHEQIFHFLDRQCDRLGYTGYFYAPLQGAQGGSRLFQDDAPVGEGDNLVRHSVYTTYPVAWVRRYQEADHVHIDPVIKRIATTNLPVFWDDVMQSEENISSLKKRTSMGWPMVWPWLFLASMATGRC